MTRRREPPDDAEVRRFIDRAPRRLTFSELEREVRRRFGQDRAWSREAIARYWHRTQPAGPESPSRLAQDPELHDFVEDRLGRHTLDEIVAACRRRFGAARTPSRSALHRRWQKLRRAALRDGD